MLIIDTIKSITDTMTSIKSFGHGVRSYANLEQENESLAEYGSDNFPRCWLYTFDTEEKITASGGLERVYTLLIDISKLHSMDDSSEQITAQLSEMYDVASEFILRLNKDSNTEYIKNIVRNPLQHHLDHNSIGCALKFKIKLFRDPVTYPCN